MDELRKDPRLFTMLAKPTDAAAADSPRIRPDDPEGDSQEQSGQHP